jgi:protein phosphatase
MGGRDAATPEVDYVGLNHSDQLLLCTDGLTDMVDEASIAAILSTAGSAATACQNLVDAALIKGGKDNVTVVLGRYCFPASSPTENRGALS